MQTQLGGLRRAAARQNTDSGESGGRVRESSDEPLPRREMGGLRRAAVKNKAERPVAQSQDGVEYVLLTVCRQIHAHNINDVLPHW